MLNKKALSATAAAQALYVEDVFSTYLYTGTGSTLTITNGIDLAGEGGMLWHKARNASAAPDHHLFDTVRGFTKCLNSNSTAAESDYTTNGPTALSSGFSIPGSGGGELNRVNDSYASWTFRKAEKFFDVVTWTGNGSGDRNISHNLGSVPGCIITKATSAAGTNWHVFHRSINSARYGVGYLNSTAAFVTGTSYDWNPTSTTFVADAALSNNDNGTTYVAYLFAHDAGGFGDSGSDNVISCGSFTGDGSGNATVTLGYEPQWVLFKSSTDGTANWSIRDNMRGMNVSTDGKRLFANTSDAEADATQGIKPTATGFTANGMGTSTYIYIAIRRGPMKTPTLGTDVFYPTTYTGPALNVESTVTAGWPVDSIWAGAKNWAGTAKTLVQDRLRTESGTTNSNSLVTSTTDNETNANTYATFKLDSNTGYKLTDSNGSWNGSSASSKNPYAWVFRRAPGFFDIVCYSAGAGSSGSPTQTFNHNLGVTPEFAISKTRSQLTSWFVYAAPLGTTKRLRLQSNGAEQTTPYFTAVSSTTFTIDNYNTGTPADNNVAYLFASVPGVSKVGSYTGTGTTLQINCGFTSTARFVMIKRTDSTGDWYVWDSARGIVSGNDPYLLLNSDAAEVTNTDYIDTYSSGFEISSTAPAAINANGGNFIFLAIA